MQASFWLLGSALGGTIGHAAMFHPALSTNAVALTAIIVAAAAGVGVLASTRARTFITLSLMTLTALILCQCCAGGRQAVTLARLVSVLAGITTAVCICNLVAPWCEWHWLLAAAQRLRVPQTAGSSPVRSSSRMQAQGQQLLLCLRCWQTRE